MKKGKRRNYRRRGVRVPKGRSYARQSNFARVVYDIQGETSVNATSAGGSGPGGQVYFADNFALTNSVRAMAVAQAYQEYRISKIEMFVKPVADTFMADAIAPGTGLSVPYFYYIIDKTGALTNSSTTTKTLRQAGAKPHRLDDKTLYIKWKPTILIGSSDAGPGGPAPVSELSATTRTSPWITTNASSNTPGSPWTANSVDHLGIAFGAEQPRGPLPTAVANVTFRVTYEFRKPLWATAEIPINPPQRIDLDQLDQPQV